MPMKEFPGGSRVGYEIAEPWGSNFQIGPDVIVECHRLSLGNNVKIGMLDDETAFRYPGGVRIRAEELVLGDGVQIDRHTLVHGGRFVIGRGVYIGPENTFRVNKQLRIGANGTINEQCEISGVDIVIGREFRMLPQAKIGGGSAFEVHSRLRLGNWCHVGMRCMLNTARPITIGDDVGLGTSTCLYTHGAYASALDGKPVAFGPISIGDRTWIPGAIVNPSVSIGRDCVIGVGSVVSRNIPDGSLAAGTPARIIRENAYPKPFSESQRSEFCLDFLKTFADICSDRWQVSQTSLNDTSISLAVDNTVVGYASRLDSQHLAQWDTGVGTVVLTGQLMLNEADIPSHVTVIELLAKRITGPATPVSERLINQLRRYGIRFPYETENRQYVPWPEG
jgi:acetyltransferase-like isoleucine patch superfamily enzyme